MKKSQAKKAEIVFSTAMADIQWELKRINANLSILQLLKDNLKNGDKWTNESVVDGVRLSLIDSMTALENCSENIYNHLYPEQNEGNQK